MKIRDDFIIFGAPKISTEEIEEVIHTLKSGWIGAGPKVKKFEEDFKKFKKCDYAIAVNSCTAALQLALVGLDIGDGDEVITTAYTFCATINAIIHSGAKPVLVDVRRDTLNINPQEIERNITSRTKAILIVHFAGRPCDMDAIMSIAKKHNLRVIEDCAHAVESEYKGRPLGTIGDVGCFSFYATKNITTGEGGMVTTNSEPIAERIKSLSLHGLSYSAWNRFGSDGFKHYSVDEIGFKFNMTDIQASIGIHQLNKISQLYDARKNVWNIYQSRIKIPGITLPLNPEPVTLHGLHLFPIFIGKEMKLSRDELLVLLAKYKIGAGVHYLSIPEHPVYKKNYGWLPESFPAAMNLGRSEISLPISGHMSSADANYVVDALEHITSNINASAK